MHITNIMYLIIIAPLSMYKGRRSRSFEEDFPHHNWFIVVLVLPFVFNVGYVILTPSIYQFVTTPRSLPEELENGEVCSSKLYTHQAYNYTHIRQHIPNYIHVKRHLCIGALYLLYCSLSTYIHKFSLPNSQSLYL